jgi:O-antigen ligase
MFILLAGRFLFSGLLWLFVPLLILLSVRRDYTAVVMAVIWLLFMSDYSVPHDEINPFEWAKTFKFIGPVLLSGLVLINPDIRRAANPLFLRLTPFFIIAGAALFYSVNQQIGIQKFVSYFLLFWSIPKIIQFEMQEKGLRPVLDIFFFLFFIMLSAYLAMFIDTDHAFIKQERLSGFFGNPNGLAIFATLSLGLLFAIEGELHLLRISLDKKWIFWPIIILVLLTGSRNGVLSILLLFTCIYVFKNQVVPMLTGGIVLTFLVLLIDASAVGLVQMFGLEEYFRIHTLEEGSGRSVAWNFAWQKIQDYFFIGGGFGHDENIMRAHYVTLTKLGHEGGVHNSYLSMWFDAGLLGVLAYFSAVISLFLKANARNSFALPVLLTILFNAIFESWLVASLNPFTIIFVIIVSVLVSDRNLHRA